MTDIESMNDDDLVNEVAHRIHVAVERNFDLGAKLGLVTSRAEQAEARVKELTEENARLEQELSTTGEDSEHRFMEMKRLAEERDDLRAENERLEQKLERRKDVVDRLVEDRALWMSKAGDYKTQADDLRTAVPRVIRPDEVRKGQTVAYTPYHLPGQWIVKAFAHDHPFHHSYIGTVILLRDAPEDEEPAVRAGEQIGTMSTTSCDIETEEPAENLVPEQADDFPCCRVKRTGICEDVG